MKYQILRRILGGGAFVLPKALTPGWAATWEKISQSLPIFRANCNTHLFAAGPALLASIKNEAKQKRNKKGLGKPEAPYESIHPHWVLSCRAWYSVHICCQMHVEMRLNIVHLPVRSDLTPSTATWPFLGMWLCARKEPSCWLWSIICPFAEAVREMLAVLAMWEPNIHKLKQYYC